MTPSPVMVAVDPHEPLTPVLDAAASLAQALERPLALVHVLPTNDAVHEDVHRNPKAHPAAHAAMRTQSEAAAVGLREAAQALHADGHAVTVHIAHGPVAEGLVRVAIDLDAAYVVLGTHGRTGVTRLALGSVAESVVRHAPMPVVTIAIEPPDLPGAVTHHTFPTNG